MRNNESTVNRLLLLLNQLKINTFTLKMNKYYTERYDSVSTSYTLYVNSEQVLHTYKRKVLILELVNLWRNQKE